MKKPTRQSHLVLFSVHLKHRYGAFSVNLISWGMLPHTLGLQSHVKIQMHHIMVIFPVKVSLHSDALKRQKSEVHLTRDKSLKS